MEQTIIKLQFFIPVDGQTEFYFSSLAAIYEKFNPEQVGCPLASLWNSKIEIGKPRATKKCVVSREPIYNKPQTNKSK